jgi:glycosyltransferase involved in cell wall biosynthesis
MRILFLALDVNLGNKTGDSIHVQELATSLAREQNEVFLIVADTGDKPSLNWVEKTPNLHIFFNRAKGVFRSVSTARYCRKIAKKHKAQIIYERRTSPKIGFVLSKSLGIPLTVEINAVVEEEIRVLGKEKAESRPQKNIKKRIRKKFFLHAKKIVTVTESIKSEMQRNYGISGDKVVVIPNGANTDIFRPMDKQACRQELGLETHGPYICFVGALTPWQGVDFMIEALPLVIKDMPDAKFLVVGDGTQKKLLEKKAKELGVEKKVIFKGWVEYEDVPKYINASEICVAPLTTGREKSGSSAIKIYEYLACGKPVIASHVADLDFLGKHECGILVQKDDASALAEAVLMLARDMDRATEMGEKGRKIVVENYSWVNTAKRIDRMLKRLV